MKFLSLALVPLIVGILIPIIFEAVRKSNLKKTAKMNKYNFIICQPLFLVWISICAIVFLSTILILLNLSELRVIVNIIIIPIIIMGFFTAIGCVRERIIVRYDTIIVTSAFGKTKKFAFKEIKKIKQTSWSNGMITCKVYADKKIFSISDGMIGYNLFMERIREEKIMIEK